MIIFLNDIIGQCTDQRNLLQQVCVINSYKIRSMDAHLVSKVKRFEKKFWTGFDVRLSPVGTTMDLSNLQGLEQNMVNMSTKSIWVENPTVPTRSAALKIGQYCSRSLKRFLQNYVHLSSTKQVEKWCGYWVSRDRPRKKNLIFFSCKFNKSITSALGVSLCHQERF